MTLPPIRQPLCGDSFQPLRPPSTTASPRGAHGAAAARNSGPRRSQQCFSAVWADPPSIYKKEWRRAVCSWSVDYGTLTAATENLLTPPLLAEYDSGLGRGRRKKKKKKVPDDDVDDDDDKGKEDEVDDEEEEVNGKGDDGKRRNGNAISVPHAATATSNATITNSTTGRTNVATAVATTAPPFRPNVGNTTKKSNSSGNGNNNGRNKRAKVDFLTMPGLKSLVTRRRNSGGGVGDVGGSADATSVPLVRRDGGCGALIKPAASLASLRKCETVIALAGAFAAGSSSSSSSSTTSSASFRRHGSMEPLRPVNRLRVSPYSSASRLCSRCSSLLTLASSSRYSLNASMGGFVQVPDEPPMPCKLCLNEVPFKKSFNILSCGCSFCSECMKTYVEIEIAEGAYDISCPDALCPSQGVLNHDEIRRLVGDDLLSKHKKYRLNREIEIDKTRTWCPQAGCETVCTLCPTQRCQPQSVHCPTCTLDFCSNCKLEWHQGVTCEENNRRLAKQGKIEEAGIPFDSDLIKCCPMCNVPIEKDEGCAQMMCKRCKHVFCWYCLASLDDDFLLRHYDKGPCKNKLGHSRASVIWHRTQVIGIFAGFGILLLLASPLLLLAAPCIVCCKCRFCNAGSSKLDNEDELPGENS